MRRTGLFLSPGDRSGRGKKKSDGIWGDRNNNGRKGLEALTSWTSLPVSSLTSPCTRTYCKLFFFFARPSVTQTWRQPGTDTPWRFKPRRRSSMDFNSCNAPSYNTRAKAKELSEKWLVPYAVRIMSSYWGLLPCMLSDITDLSQLLTSEEEALVCPIMAIVSTGEWNIQVLCLLVVYLAMGLDTYSDMEDYPTFEPIPRVTIPSKIFFFFFHAPGYKYRRCLGSYPTLDRVKEPHSRGCKTITEKIPPIGSRGWSSFPCWRGIEPCDKASLSLERLRVTKWDAYCARQPHQSSGIDNRSCSRSYPRYR